LKLSLAQRFETRYNKSYNAKDEDVFWKTHLYMWKSNLCKMYVYIKFIKYTIKYS
jgi:hypothetical protein